MTVRIPISGGMRFRALASLAIMTCCLFPVATSYATGTQSRPEDRAPADRSAQDTRIQSIKTHVKMGVEAFGKANFTAAVAAFDAADRLAGGYLFLSPEVHAMRAASFDDLGRTEDALRDAQIAFDYLNEGPTVSKDIRDGFFSTTSMVDADVIYASATAIFHKAKDPRYEASLRALMALTPTDAQGWTNRGGLLNEIGRFEEAVEASQRAVNLKPRNPLILNNHCFILSTANRAEQSLPFCTRAIKRAPNVGAIRNSYSTALALLGRCREAGEQKAIALRMEPSSTEASKPLVCTPRP